MTKDQLWENFAERNWMAQHTKDDFFAVLSIRDDYVKAKVLKLIANEKITDENITHPVQWSYNHACDDCTTAVEKMQLP